MEELLALEKNRIWDAMDLPQEKNLLVASWFL